MKGLGEEVLLALMTVLADIVRFVGAKFKLLSTIGRVQNNTIAPRFFPKSVESKDLLESDIIDIGMIKSEEIFRRPMELVRKIDDKTTIMACEENELEVLRVVIIIMNEDHQRECLEIILGDETEILRNRSSPEIMFLKETRRFKRALFVEDRRRDGGRRVGRKEEFFGDSLEEVVHPKKE